MEYERYISDGILEKHFLGFTTPEEEAELRINLNIFPELRNEMNEVERRLEKVALRDAPMPPAHIRASLMTQIAAESATGQTFSYNVNYRDVKAPQLDDKKISGPVAFKTILIVLLSMIALSLVAAVMFYMATLQQ